MNNKILILYVLSCLSCVYGEYNLWTEHDEPTSEGIFRPCPDFNLDCIRRFFTSCSHCTPVYGPPRDPYPVPRLEMPIANANLTFIWNNAQVTGLKDAEVEEFYVNPATNKVVMEISIQAISCVSPASIARYHIKGREPVELSDRSSITYRMVSLTVTIPFHPHTGLQMSRALTYAYMGDSRGYADVGSKLSSTEPELQRAYRQMIDNIATSMREAFIVQGPLHFKEYLESNICSFEHPRHFH